MSAIINHVKRLLDQTGMYRTVTLALVFIVICSFATSYAGWLPYSVVELSLSLSFAVALAVAANVLVALVLRIPANHESAVITALILFFLFLPPQTLEQWFFYGVAIVVAIVSKFVLVWRKQHIVNAAAFGTVAVTLPYFTEAPWWVATPVLFMPLVLAGSIVVTKIRRWEMVGTFLLVAAVTYVVVEQQFGVPPADALTTFLFSWPALFLAFFMLTEPFSMPGTTQKQIMYGALVGWLSSTAVFTPYFAMTPELALVIGNVALYPFSLRQKLFLEFKERRELAKDTWEYIFAKPVGMQFKAGQYLEWMLPHEAADSRGPRRYFTIASAPEEADIRLALRIEPYGGSTYKRALAALAPGDQLIASQRAGDFTLPHNSATKLAFVAGGIGVTPFSSHLAHMQETGEWHDTVLYYCNNRVEEIAYQPEFTAYEAAGPFTLVNVLTKEEHPEYEHGYLTKEILERHTPDYRDRIWYLSGPPGMVNAYYQLLRELEVPKRHIKRDFFPGLA